MCLSKINVPPESENKYKHVLNHEFTFKKTKNTNNQNKTESNKNIDFSEVIKESPATKNRSQT
jgi:hypothetical protein